MKNNYPQTQHQTGVSLISLMIGMLISILVILGSFGLHKNLVQISVQSKMSSKQDALLASAMLHLQYSLHNAGSGLTQTDTNDVVTKTTGTQRDIYWRYYEGNTYVCKGVREHAYAANSGTPSGREIIELETTDTCEENTDLRSLTWQSNNVLARFVNQTSELLQFQVVTASCSPFGLGPAEQHLMVKVSAKSSAELSGASVTTNEYHFCLANTYMG